MAHYLLRTEEHHGENATLQQHLIEAADEQMVKYHFHRTLKDWGYTETQFNKHSLENWDTGTLIEIDGIVPLDPTEYEILDRHLYGWAKV